MCPFFSQLRQVMLAGLGGSGHSRDMWPSFSQLRQIMTRSLVHSLALWPSWLQLRQSIGPRFSLVGQSREK